MKKPIRLALLAAAPLLLSACALAAGAAGGAVVADELNEDDGEFDPAEKAYDGDDETDPIVD